MANDEIDSSGSNAAATTQSPAAQEVADSDALSTSASSAPSQQPVSQVAPPQQFTDMNTGFQAILGAIKTSSDELKTEMRSEVKAGFETVNGRIDEVEDDVVQLQSITSVAVRKIAVLENRTSVTERAVSSIDHRVSALESGVSGVAKKKTLSEIIADETDRVRSLIAEAHSYQRVAVVGCHGRREPSKSGIARLVNSHSSGIEVRYDIRGLVARVTFGEDGRNPPATRARMFVEDINSRQAAAIYWSKVDEPRTLRDLKARARGFGEAVAQYCSTMLRGGDPVRYSIVDGFLVVGDVVVGPLTMIPAECDRIETQNLVSNILLHPHHRAVDFRVPLEKQMRMSISNALHKIHNKPSFIDTAEELLAGPLNEDIPDSDDELVDGNPDGQKDDSASSVAATASSGEASPGDEASDDEESPDSVYDPAVPSQSKLATNNPARQQRGRKRKKKSAAPPAKKPSLQAQGATGKPCSASKGPGKKSPSRPSKRFRPDISGNVPIT